MAVEDTQANSDKCICGDCPSYPGNEPWLYCARGMSPLKIDKSDCLCPGCPIWTENGLGMTFYCVIGTE